MIGLLTALAAVAVRQALLPLTGDRAPFAVMFIGVLFASLLLIVAARLAWGLRHNPVDTPE